MGRTARLVRKITQLTIMTHYYSLQYSLMKNIYFKVHAIPSINMEYLNSHEIYLSSYQEQTGKVISCLED